MNGCRFARVLVPALIGSSLIAQCPPQGLTMTIAGGRLGDPAFLYQGDLSIFPFGTDPSAPVSTVVTVPVPARLVLTN